jgi:imidazolonepropionase-like amidohydrolase
VDDLVRRGARVIKIPFDGTPVLDDETIAAAVDAAHAARLLVAAHALSGEAAARAALLGCDVLAHTPTGELDDAVVEAWKERAVISTLLAFGAGNAAQQNLMRLHAAGTTILYGTDLGNSQVVGIDTNELALLETLGLSRGDVLATATSSPASFWGIEIGKLEVGREASFVIWAQSPLDSLEVLENPAQVYFRGQLLAAR